MMRRFDLPDEWEHIPELRERIIELLESNRHRTAMEEVLRYLRHDPSSVDAMFLALAIFSSLNRTGIITSPEPLTDVQRASALLAPIITECSGCRSGWVSKHSMLHASKVTVELRLANPSGLQCQECRYTLCRNCLGGQRTLVNLRHPCPASECRGILTTPVLPTGRYNVLPIDPESIGRVIVTRKGPIAPTMDEAIRVVTKFIPILTDDAPLIRICANVPGMMDDKLARDRVPAFLIHEMERDRVLGPGSWERSTPLFIDAGAADDTDYIVVVVRKQKFAPADWHRNIAYLIGKHLQHMIDGFRGAAFGECWSGLGGQEVVTASAELLHQALLTARQPSHLVPIPGATRTCALAEYAIAATVVLAPDNSVAQSWFDGGYLEYCAQLDHELRYPVGDRRNPHFVHWIMVTGSETEILHATVLPASRTELALFAMDLMTPAERRQVHI